MYTFETYVQFEPIGSDIRIQINLSFKEHMVPVYIRTIHETTLNQQDDFMPIYEQISEYFSNRNVNMTKKDLVLFYNTLNNFHFHLPNVLAMTIIEGWFESHQLLTPKEMLLLLYLHGKSVDGKKAKYFVDEYHMSLDDTIERLLQLEYLTTDDYLFNIEKSTKSELEIVLKARNIPYKDKKSDMVDAVTKQIPLEDLSNLFSHKYYKWTTKGNTIKEKEEKLNEFHKSYYRFTNGLSIDEFYLLKQEYEDIEAKDVCKLMVENQDKGGLTDFNWDNFFDGMTPMEKKTEEVSLDDAFQKIISKYTTNINKPVEKVTDSEFMKLVFKTEAESMPVDVKLEPVPIEKVEAVSDDLFMNLINKEYSDTKTVKQIPMLVEEKFTIKVKSVVKPHFLSHFITRFVVSSLMSIMIIYYLYKFVLV